MRRQFKSVKKECKNKFSSVSGRKDGSCGAKPSCTLTCVFQRSCTSEWGCNAFTACYHGGGGCSGVESGRMEAGGSQLRAVISYMAISGMLKQR